MRVLHIINGMDRGGAETLIMNVYRGINREKIQFDFLVTSQEECSFDKEILVLGGKIFRIPSRKDGLIERRKAIEKFFLNNSNYDVIHHHLSSLTDISVGIIASKFNIKKIIAHSHNTKQGSRNRIYKILHRLLHYINRYRVNKYYTDFFACSQKAGEWCFRKQQYKIIKNGIWTDKFSYNKEMREKIRNEFHLQDKIVLGHIGRFQEQKNHKFIIDIFKEISKKNSNIVLMLVGDGALKNEIENKVKKLGLENSVIFTGVKENTNELLQSMDLFLFPSLYEGLPLTLIEAQASGLTCLVSDVITRELQITNLISFFPLQSDNIKWSERVLELLKTGNRENTEKNIINAGFDIERTLSILEEYYIN